MKIYLTTQGDPSVGIQGECITVDWPGLEGFFDGDEEERPHLREHLAETFGKWLGERAVVTYEDECPECGRPGRQQGLGCPHVDCPDNSDAARLAAIA